MKSLLSRLVRFVLGVSTLVVVGASQAQSASASQVFSLDDNLSLNTNNSYARLDGYPKMSLWPRNLADADQQFDQLGANAGVLLKQKSTGLCLNAARKYSLGQVGTWPCNGGDADQQFNIIDAGSGYSLIRLNGTNWCLNAPNHTAQANVTLFSCNTGDRDQRFRVENTQQDVYTTRDYYTTKYYAVISSGNGTFDSGQLGSFAGHSWVAIFPVSLHQVLYYRNGVLYQSSQFDSWSLDKSMISTFTAWPKAELSVPTINYKSDLDEADNVIRGITNPNNILRFREISVDTYNAALSQYRAQTTCTSYLYVPVIGLDQLGRCNCSSASTRYWKLITGEDFTNFTIPMGLKGALYSYNGNRSMNFQPLPTLIP